MIHHRERSEVRRFDIFKLIVLIILIALLLWFWLSPPAFVQGPDDGTGETAVANSTDTEAETSDGIEAGEEETEAETAVEPTENTAVPTLDGPTLDTPALADGVLAGRATLGGTGTPGSTVRVVLDGQPVGEVVVAEDGGWSLDVDLAAGTHELTLEALDAAGSVANSAELPAFEARLDVPTLTLAEESLLAGPVTLSGTGTPGSDVGIVVDDELVGTATVGEDGTWTFDAELAAGTRGVQVQALDAVGNVVNESEGFGLTLAEITPPAFAEASYAFTPGVVDFSGVGTPGTTVELLANGEVVGTAVVADDGTWALPVTLEAGDYDLSLRMLAADGAVLGEAEGVSATVAAAEAVVEETAETAAAEFAPPTFNLPEGDLVGGEITLTGAGTPGSEVAVVVNDEVVGTAVVADDGTWALPATLPAGEYELSLQAVDGSGTAVTTEPVTLTLAEAPDTAAEDSSDVGETAVAPLPADFCKNAAPGIDQGNTYIVGVCEWLTKIANRLGIPYPDLIGVNPQIENPNLIYPGQVINLPPR